MKFNNTNKKYKCCYCEDEFDTKAEINKHQKEHNHVSVKNHNVIGTKERCEKCSGFFCTF